MADKSRKATRKDKDKLLKDKHIPPHRRAIYKQHRADFAGLTREQKYEMLRSHLSWLAGTLAIIVVIAFNVPW